MPVHERGAGGRRTGDAADDQSVSFVDDNFLANVPRAFKIVELIRQRGIKMNYYGMQARTDTISKHPDLVEAWREVGLETILIGFEAATQARLDAVSKGATVEQNEKAMDILNRLRIHMWGAFIVDPAVHEGGLPANSRPTASRRAIIYPQFTILTPLPGTDLYQRAVPRAGDARLPPVRRPARRAAHAAAARGVLQGVRRPLPAGQPGLVYDWISSGRITIDRARKAREILMELGNPENFLKGEQAAAASPAPGRIPRGLEMCVGWHGHAPLRDRACGRQARSPNIGWPCHPGIWLDELQGISTISRTRRAAMATRRHA